MGKYDFIKIKKKLSKYLDEARFEHTMGVMYTCAALAMVYDYDLEDAQAAGLLHDSAKCIPNKKKLNCAASMIFRYQILKRIIRFFFMPNWGLMWPAVNMILKTKRS